MLLRTINKKTLTEAIPMNNIFFFDIDPFNMFWLVKIENMINIIKNIVFIVWLNGKKKFISKAKKLSEIRPIKEIKLRS